MSYLIDDGIKFDDGPHLTAFGELRTSLGRILGEYRYMYGDGTTAEMNSMVAGSGTLTPDYIRNCFIGHLGTSSGDRAVRQTKQYHPYIVGTSNIAKISFVMSPRKTNLVQSVGLFDDQNGMFFRMNGIVPEVVVRKNSVDVELYPQTAWNRDRMDGTKNQWNPSGITLDFTKAQTLIVDYQWLGVGRVRIGFIADSTVTYVHQFDHANIVSEVYTYQPSLPIRWEINNVGVTESESNMMIICGAVYCEGTDAETGFSRAISTGTSTVSLTTANSANGYGVLAVRLRNVLQGKNNRSLARLKSWAVFSNNDMAYKVVILPGTVSLNNPAVTWSRVPGYGWCEYIKDFSLAAGWNSTDNYHVIIDEYAAGAGGNNSGHNAINSLDNRSNAIYQNYDSTDSQILAVIGYRLSTDASVRANLTWIEVK